MEKNSQASTTVNRKLNTFLALFMYITTVALIFLSGYAQDGFNIQEGSPAMQRFKAPRKIENRIATERNRMAALDAADKMEPILERDTDVAEKINTDLEIFFSYIKELRDLRKLAENNPPDDFATTEPVLPTTTPQNLQVKLTPSMSELLISMETADFLHFKKQVEVLLATVLDRGIQELDAKNLMYVKNEAEKLDLVADTKTLCYDIVTAYLVPNIVVNEEETEQAKTKRASEYEIVYFLKDETIVDEGQRISREAFIALQDLGIIREGYLENPAPVLGSVLIVSFMFFLAFMFIANFSRNILTVKRDALFISTLYLINIFINWSLSAFNFEYYFQPIAIFTMLLSMILDSRLAIMLNLVITVVSAIICRADINYILYFTAIGIFISLLSKYTIQRSKIIIVGFFAFVFNFLVLLGICLFVDKKYTPEILYSAIFAASFGFLSVILTVGSLPVWEATFGVVTSIKLLDLTNPGNVLLRRLSIEAPGTYHHSLIVSNLAEEAAIDIDANSYLARVGGYYHDIGKLKYPHFFSENQIAENPHDKMDPMESVDIIKSHVEYGLQLANEHKLPIVVKDIVTQHHGNSIIRYFLHKAQTGSEQELNEEDFRYTFMKPQSKEAAVVMLADTVEAAVRSTGKNIKDVEALVRRLVQDKLDDGQLMDSLLTIKDLETIIGSFMRVFKGMYHERIPYPKTNREKTQGDDGNGNRD